MGFKDIKRKFNIFHFFSILLLFRPRKWSRFTEIQILEALDNDDVSGASNDSGNDETMRMMMRRQRSRCGRYMRTPERLERFPGLMGTILWLPLTPQIITLASSFLLRGEEVWLKLPGSGSMMNCVLL